MMRQAPVANNTHWYEKNKNMFLPWLMALLCIVASEAIPQMPSPKWHWQYFYVYLNSNEALLIPSKTTELFDIFIFVLNHKMENVVKRSCIPLMLAVNDKNRYGIHRKVHKITIEWYMTLTVKATMLLTTGVNNVSIQWAGHVFISWSNLNITISISSYVEIIPFWQTAVVRIMNQWNWGVNLWNNVIKFISKRNMTMIILNQRFQEDTSFSWMMRLSFSSFTLPREEYFIFT